MGSTATSTQEVRVSTSICLFQLGPNYPEKEIIIPYVSSLWSMAFLWSLRAAIVTKLILMAQVVEEDSIEVRAAIKEALDRVNVRLTFNYCNDHQSIIFVYSWNTARVVSKLWGSFCSCQLKNWNTETLKYWKTEILQYWKTEILKYRQGCEQGRPREEVPALADRLQPRRRRTHSHSQGSPCSGFTFRSWSEKLAGKNVVHQCMQPPYAQVKRHVVSEKYSAQIDEMYQHEEISSMWWPKEHKMESVEINIARIANAVQCHN